MKYVDTITIHECEENQLNFPTAYWEKNERQGIEARFCSFCGSLHPEDLYKFLDSCDRAEFADRKYGYPHKIYLDIDNAMLKFYTRHLIDLKDPETIEAILERVKDRTGIWLKSHLDE